VSPTAQALTSAELAQELAGFALEKKAHDVLELDMRGLVGYTDFFLICSGNTDRQVKAIHDAIHEGAKHTLGILPRRVEGVGRSQWVLMDYLDVVVHIFTPTTREFYRLEQLWGEAPARVVEEAPVDAAQ
jgi:ribosome-associated protein